MMPILPAQLLIPGQLLLSALGMQDSSIYQLISLLFIQPMQGKWKMWLFTGRRLTVVTMQQKVIGTQINN